jgi:GNAT superfamily N-acetyltransferase
MKIEYLADNPNYAEQVAVWMYNEFVKGIRFGVSYEDVLENYRNRHKTRLPLTLVAIVDEACAGTISLKENDLRCRTYTPWLASLYVDVPFRGKKIAEILIERVKTIAADMGYTELYLRTEHASGYYKKRGWTFVESCEDEYNLVPDVFKCGL